MIKSVAPYHTTIIVISVPVPVYQLFIHVPLKSTQSQVANKVIAVAAKTIFIFSMGGLVFNA